MRQHQDEIQARDIQIMSQNQQLLEKDRVIQDKDSVIQDNERALQDREEVVQEKERALQDKDREIALRERQLRQLNQQLEEQEQVKAEIQHSLQRQVDQLLQLSQQLKKTNSDSMQRPPREQKVTLNWRDGGKAPFEMRRGAAVVDGGVAYFMNWDGQTCSYNSTSKRWSELPKYPHERGSLAIINGQLTAIGGCVNWNKKHTYTNKLLSLRGSWSDVFPPMPSKRRNTIAITSKEHLIVAGGATGRNCADNINTVEVMDTKTLVWSTVASLPHPYNWASATICGDHLYMLGGWDGEDKIKSVLTCSLTELLQSSSSSSSSVWHRVTDAPAYHSTGAAVNGQLLAVGGCDDVNKDTTAIHKYNRRANSWDLISNMPTGRFACLVAVLPNNEIVVVGGLIFDYINTDKVEIGII